MSVEVSLDIANDLELFAVKDIEGTISLFVKDEDGASASLLFAMHEGMLANDRTGEEMELDRRNHSQVEAWFDDQEHWEAEAVTGFEPPCPMV